MAHKDPLPAILNAFAPVLSMKSDPALDFAALDPDEAEKALADDEEFALSMFGDLVQLAQKYRHHDTAGAFMTSFYLLRAAWETLQEDVATHIDAEADEAAADATDHEYQTSLHPDHV